MIVRDQNSVTEHRLKFAFYHFSLPSDDCPHADHLVMHVQLGKFVKDKAHRLIEFHVLNDNGGLMSRITGNLRSTV